jgi:hypothetical protein
LESGALFLLVAEANTRTLGLGANLYQRQNQAIIGVIGIGSYGNALRNRTHGCGKVETLTDPFAEIYFWK